MAIKPIEILIRAKDEASSMLSGIQAKVAAVAVAVAGFFGIALFTGAVRSAAEFEAALSRVKAAAGATDEQFKLLKQAAEDVGASTKYSGVQAAAALENLAKAGLNVKDSLAALPAVLALAQAGDIGLGESAEYVTKAVMGMGLAFSDSARVADVLAMGANASNTSVVGLAQALSYAAPTAKSLGLSLEFTVAIIGKFADAGIDASRAGTALNAVMSQFSDPASKFRQELGNAGIITNNFEQALRELAKAGPNGAKAINAVGLEAGPALKALLGQGIGALDELKHKLDESAGSAAKMALVMQDNLAGSMTSLGSVWTTIKNVLGTPVLPVLKDGVDQLAGALRGMIADGTINTFGESMAAAFQGGIKWARDFLAQVNFTQIAADMRAFADSSRETFDKIGEYASAAGNSVKLAYGVMSAGVNTVLTAVYGIGSVFAEVASTVMSGIAKLRDGLASVTFGEMSKMFRLAADDARDMAQGFGEAAQAMRDKASAAMQDVAQSAQIARDGFAGLAGAITAAEPAADASAKAFGEMAIQLEAAADKTAAIRKAVEEKAAADQAAALAMRELRLEYAELIAKGDLQAAAEKLQEINKVLRDTPAASKDAADAAQKIADAFQRMGVTSTADLKKLADGALRDFNIIKNSGTATAADLTALFKVYAEKAIAANGGVATEVLKGQAAMRGLAIETDATGKSIVKAMGNGGDAAEKLTGSVNAATSALERQNAELEKTISAQEKANQLAERAAALEDKRLNRDKEGFSVDPKTGQRVNMAVDTQASTYERAKSQGLSEEQALQIMERFINERGEKKSFGDGGYFGALQGQTWASELQKAINELKVENARNAVANQKNQQNPQPTEAPQAPAREQVPPAQRDDAAQRGGSSAMGVNLTINVAAGADLGSRAQIDQLARQLMPAIESLRSKGVR